MKLSSTHLRENLANDAAAVGAEAMRTAISARRVVARASIRLAMLAQAISKTTEERIISILRPRPFPAADSECPRHRARAHIILGMIDAPPLAVSIGRV